MRIPVKISLRASSWIAAFLLWALFSALAVLVIWQLRDRSRLIRDNDNERIFNTLFTNLRGYEDLDSLVRENPVLAERIRGFGLYGRDRKAIYRWGNGPDVFNEDLLRDMPRSRFGRYTIQDPKGRGIKFVLHWSPPPAPPPGPGPASGEFHQQRMTQRRNTDAGSALLPAGPMGGLSYFYVDIDHPAYWRNRTLTGILLVLIEPALLALVFSVRRLYLRNREYRECIESQKNLVVLGTAASTLAHEIKNPLLSIRLQTGILQKLGGGAGEEIGRINEEVDRISALVYRVNDYLREAGGNRGPLNVYRSLEETSLRLCGRNIISGQSVRDGMILADGDRMRSVFENLIRNALEAGGPAEKLEALIRREGREIFIEIADQGRGIGQENLKRIFDPFFTSKSTGTGIGLSICKRFVEAIGGSITLENREGGGTLARLTIPALA
ncbi:MAG: HAMP domain-containing histidine kinase [Treponema sp.]|jgi:two-component system sensor histidine kinase HydH|nr:HAMP domain-containing histidine kinase [Treponema sp.]